MRIALLSAASSAHTIRWANGLAGLGHDVHLLSLHTAADSLAESVTFHRLPGRGIAAYFTAVPKVREHLRRIKPDILNAHFASGYGTTARLAAFHPWVLSVWGSDIYDFPKKSVLHRWLVDGNLRSADAVASTSLCMADEVRLVAPDIGEIAITPFGVDMDCFAAVEPLSSVQKIRLLIGTVKTMAPKYGVDTLIKAFAILQGRMEIRRGGEVPDIELRLVGGGSATGRLKRLASELGVAGRVEFVGWVPHRDVPTELAKLDIYAALSRMESESFGVAILEAGAAARPVVVSDAGGLPEVTVDGQTGFVVPKDDPAAAADALETLVLDASLRRKMGLAGREHVATHYSWQESLEKMMACYVTTIHRHHQS